MDMHIGELARAAGVNIQTIRFYERQALLPKPPRNSSGYRSYEHKDVERVTFIKRNQELGFTLTEIKQLIQLHEAKARLEKSMRARDLVAVDLGYVAIRAPITGTIASVSTQEGETVAASFASPTFVTIIADHALQLVGMVDETDIAHVRPGNPVTFTVDAYPARDFPGRVESIAPKATIVSGVVNYEVTIRITESAELLKPDMTANLSIQTAETDALLLPATALKRDADGAFVYVAGKNATER